LSPRSRKKAGADWAVIARDYAASALTVSEICALHGIHRNILYRHVRSESWEKRAFRKHCCNSLSVAADAPTPDQSMIAANKPLTSRPIKRPRNLARRLLTALDKKMTEFENRLAEGGPFSAADSERDARTLNTLARLFDKLKDVGRKTRSTKAATLTSSDSNATGTQTHDADRLRHDLAQRLEKLRCGLDG